MTAKEILNLIPRETLSSLSADLKIDHQVKKLDGISIFQLILFSMLNSQKVSLRVLEEFYHSASFRSINNSAGKTTRYNSIRDRIANIDSKFFELIFHHTYDTFQKYFSDKQTKNILRVDSTMVAISSKLVNYGMKVGSKTNKNQIKFTIGLKGLLPGSVKVFTHQQALSEDITLREAILDCSQAKESIVVFDRGLQSRKAYGEFDSNGILFVTRLKHNARYEKIRQLNNECQENGTLIIEEDNLINLYDQNNRILPKEFRLVSGKIKQTGEKITFLTNIKDLSTLEIADIYKQRWAIEVFFKFLKQELNFNHLVCRTGNGIEVMLYMTLILAILLIAYKELNRISGYKIAKIRFANELEIEIMKEIVILCGGDPFKLNEKFKLKPS